MPRPSRTSFRWSAQAAWIARIAGSALVASAFVVPYFVPVEPSVSQSYACGFNNHAALLLFLAGGLLLAVPVGGVDSARDPVDRRMPRWTLFAAVLVTLVLCTVWRLDRRGKPLGSEGHYQLDRQAAMVRGERLYRDLEFIYGPALVLPGYWIQKTVHTTALRAYMTAWFADWIVGTAMLWWMIDWLDLPNRHRVPLFVLLDAYTLLCMPTEGTHYTPLRMYCAGFFSVAVSHFWHNGAKPRAAAALMVGAVLCGFLISPEQGTALGLGLSAYAIWLAWKTPKRYPWPIAVWVPIGTAMIAAMAGQLGLLRSMHGFARGGNNFPLLPSLTNLFVLPVYLVALAVAYRAFRRPEWNIAAVPLVFCGLPLMSSAFGRCDLEHLLSAVPMFLLGVFWLVSRPRLFWPWFAVACLLLLNVRATTGRLWGTLQKLHAPPSLAERPPSVTSPQGSPIPARAGYFAPFALPVGVDGTARWGAESGTFFGIQNVLTPEDIHAKAREIRNRRAPALLLPDNPDAPRMHFWAAEENIAVVQAAEASWWAPVPRRSVPSTQEVTDTINAMYAPTPFRQDGWRVWALR